MKAAVLSLSLLALAAHAQEQQSEQSEQPEQSDQQQTGTTPPPEQQPEDTQQQDGQDQSDDQSSLDFNQNQQAIIAALPEEITVLRQALDQVSSVLESVVDDTDGFTIFAPQDDVLQEAVDGADEAALEAVLQYHISNEPVDPANLPLVVRTNLASEGLGGDPQVVIVREEGDDVVVSYGAQSAKVVDPVQVVQNWIHVLDGVLLPPVAPSQAAKNVEEEDLSTFLSQLEEAELVDTVDNAQNITIFAPNNAAFENANVDSEDLSDVLQYHVIDQVAYSPELESGEFTTLQGETLTVEVGDDGSVKVNDAQVVLADILTSNGVIHVIDQVLLPDDVSSETDSTAPSTTDESVASMTTLSLGAVAAAVLAVVA